MSNAEKFYADAEKDDNLREQLEKLYKSQSDNGHLDNEILVKFANNLGYDFTAEDLQNFQEKKYEEVMGDKDGKTPGNPWTCWERWVTFNFACGWDNGFPWKCQYKEECKKHC